ncbi:hypothetical protein ACVWVY_003729 [Bradyrhizobium sp. URHC0002]
MYRTRAGAFACITCCLMVSTSAHASRDCMTQAEARKVYPTSHLYWYGNGRCWDTSPTVSRETVRAARRVFNKDKAKPKPQAMAEIVDASPVPTPTTTPAERTLTPDELRTWANSTGAMTAEPTVTIVNRWPDEELPQHRTTPTVEKPPLMSTRNISIVIALMVLLAALIEVSAGGVIKRR